MKLLRVLPLAAALGVVAVFLAYGPHLFVDLRGWLGSTTNPNGSSYDVYQAYSGVIPALAVTSIFAGIIGAARKHNCNQTRCWRLAHHTTKDGYQLCRVHVAKPMSELTLHEVHEDHR